jgi:hypothetical protein
MSVYAAPLRIELLCVTASGGFLILLVIGYKTRFAGRNTVGGYATRGWDAMLPSAMSADLTPAAGLPREFQKMCY